MLRPHLCQEGPTQTLPRGQEGGAGAPSPTSNDPTSRMRGKPQRSAIPRGAWGLGEGSHASVPQPRHQPLQGTCRSHNSREVGEDTSLTGAAGGRETASPTSAGHRDPPLITGHPLLSSPDPHLHPTRDHPGATLCPHRDLLDSPAAARLQMSPARSRTIQSFPISEDFRGQSRPGATQG